MKFTIHLITLLLFFNTISANDYTHLDSLYVNLKTKIDTTKSFNSYDYELLHIYEYNRSMYLLDSLYVMEKVNEIMDVYMYDDDMRDSLYYSMSIISLVPTTKTSTNNNSLYELTNSPNYNKKNDSLGALSIIFIIMGVIAILYFIIIFLIESFFKGIKWL
jgi:hypothetical protein